MRYLAYVVLLIGVDALAVAPPVTALTFSPDHKYVVAGSQIGLRVFNWPKLDPHDLIRPDMEHIHDVAFSPDGSMLAIVGGRPSEYGELVILDWPQRKQRAHSVGHDDVVQGVTWTSNSSLTTAAADTKVIRWTLAGPELREAALYDGHSRRVRAIVHLARPKLLVSAGVDQSLRVWKENSNQLARVLDQHRDVVHDLAARPGDHGLPQIASCGRDLTVRLWQPTIGRMMRFSKLAEEPLSLAWSPSGNLLAAACTDGTVRFIDPNSTKILGSKKIVDGWINELVAAPNEGTFVAGLPRGQLLRVNLRDASHEQEK